MQRAVAVSPHRAPRLAALVEETMARLKPGPVQVFIAPHDALNAYTFGLSAPKVLVLHSALLEVMDEDELRFVLGHELGHVALGHTWLNSLVGGMAGIPSPFVASVLLSMAFLWWNRACEFSSDRAGLLACGDVQRAITALTKLSIGRDIRSPAELERALRRVDAEDDHALSGLGEALSTHPMTIRRIEQLQRYATSDEYRRLRAMMGGIGEL
jgi:Zn-dependent protease with chaperone function